MSAAEFQVGGPGRRLLGGLVLLLALAAIALSTLLDWGMSPILWVPGLCVLPIGFGLIGIRHIAYDGTRLAIRHTGLRRQALSVTVGPDAELELVPTAGLRAVVLLQDGDETPLATWITRRRAEALVAWLEARLGRRLPRRATALHQSDV